MNIAVIEKQQVSERKLNLKQELFCKIYATDPYALGNGTDAYMKAYGLKSHESAKVLASNLLNDVRITNKIQEFLTLDGFNDVNIDKHHLFLIKQKKDLNVSMKGIQEYNKLKKRVSNSIELVIPKPLMELDDDEVIHKIDKSKAIDLSKDGSTEP